MPDIVVDTLVDENDGNISAGNLSLREAIAIAETTNEDIVFDASLAGGALYLNGALGTIMMGAGTFTINGDIDGDLNRRPDIVISGDTGQDDPTRINTMG